MEMRRISPRSLAARMAESLARPGPGKSSCLSITAVGIVLKMRVSTGTGSCTPA
jgi:hypothetical protein